MYIPMFRPIASKLPMKFLVLSFHRAVGFVKKIFKVLAIYGHGGHIDHVTWTV